MRGIVNNPYILKRLISIVNEFNTIKTFGNYELIEYYKKLRYTRIHYNYVKYWIEPIFFG